MCSSSLVAVFWSGTQGQGDKLTCGGCNGRRGFLPLQRMASLEGFIVEQLTHQQMASTHQGISRCCAQEVALIGMLGYLSYLCGELAGLSGIVTVFCCAVAISHYALHNIRRAGRGRLHAFAPPAPLLVCVGGGPESAHAHCCGRWLEASHSLHNLVSVNHAQR